MGEGVGRRRHRPIHVVGLHGIHLGQHIPRAGVASFQGFTVGGSDVPAADHRFERAAGQERCDLRQDIRRHYGRHGEFSIE